MANVYKVGEWLPHGTDSLHVPMLPYYLKGPHEMMM